MSYFILFGSITAFVQALNCKVKPEIIENPDFKCYPDLIGNEANPSTICVLDCKSNPIKYKHRCNTDGNWDLEPGSKTCNDLKMCSDPLGSWGQWTWSCSLGHQVGSICRGRCNSDPITTANIQCLSDGTWNYDVDLEDPNICTQKCKSIVKFYLLNY